ncbi:Putative glutathione-dependent formaldehyde-activating enzyme [Frankliniella fusca]|uniref:Glutathione-dependent formaldehyde-activating enzyme n=1 Tax=Frankliniella fusca TaxID=407009 RepID=A0AAE1LGJ9_9NEOP|nr:Putative glutathione-dependent formaldehyde-activating enzyme [Frankliniella fusca]
MWYTDGAAVFNSSNLSVWPLILTINELPFSERYKKGNILVPAIWCGPVKPHVYILLKPVYPDLLKVKKGIPINVFKKVENIVRGIIIVGTADLRARALMLNLVAHNGECGCQKCFQPGEGRVGCPLVRVFPFQPNNMASRNDKHFAKDGLYATSLRKAYMGVKGPTLLSQLSLFPIRGTGLDEMHMIFGGCGKTLAKLILSEEKKKPSVQHF